jgi:hypothetical protein
MRIKRALTILAAMLFAATAVTTAYSPAASATGTVSCTSDTNYVDYWVNCVSSNGNQTIWYVNGVRQSSKDGVSVAYFFCAKWHKVTVSVNLGTSLAASWTGYCEQP